MAEYQIKDAQTANINEIFFNKNTNKLSYKDALGIITAIEIVPPVPPTPFPFWLEYNETDRTVWNNGKTNDTVNGGTNTFFGQNVYKVATYGTRMTGFGAEVFSVTGGSANCTAFGANALQVLTFGNNNTAVGSNAMDANTEGSNNTAVGADALGANVNGMLNAATGTNSLLNNTTGSENTAFGNASFSSNTTGSTNTGIGYLAGVANTTGSGNTAIGSSTRTNNFNNSIILGREATATASNQFVVGSSTYNAGAVATESLTSTRTWAVVINGTAYKILLA